MGRYFFKAQGLHPGLCRSIALKGFFDDNTKIKCLVILMRHYLYSVSKLFVLYLLVYNLIIVFYETI